MGSVGSIAVAESDPNVIYAGMGEAPVRGVSSSWGDGMYRSTDAGKTWSSIGLENTRTISRVIVHPKNPDLAFVAAQGSRWGASDRGVYRTTDGGRSWKRVLFADSTTGPSDLAMDPTNPRILYAAMWDHQRTPWYVRSGGPHGGIWKTTDGGDTWTRLTTGLPQLMGKIGLSVARSAPDRVWAIIEADDGGLYRSDDGGQTWQLTSGDRVLRARAWYYTRVTADPTNPDIVYVINAPVVKSIDGGKTFKPLPDPHGDNHDLWINPANPANLIKADDGGAEISFTGGTTWSSILNQPTAQFYRVNTDDRFPYWVYSGQQDNSSVGIPSAVAGPGIRTEEMRDVGGCESAHVAFDPADPRYVYANCYLGIISEHDQQYGLDRNVMAYPFLGLGQPSDQMKYRWNWSSPIITSPHDRRVIYHGSNVLLKSTNRGQSWTAISPDLTRNDRSKQGQGGGPITNEGAGGEVYGTIYYVAESPSDAQVLWVGTDDGLIQLTRDGGKTWTNVTPKGLPESLINMIEPSTLDPATAYAAVSRHKWNDNTPFIFKTTDYGATWTRLVGGLPEGEVVRVVREDPTRRGLLYAGTETGAWVSFDGGALWQRFQLNLPHVPVTDLQIRRRDLVISTEGRAFWILDDLTPLYELAETSATAPLQLVTPRPTYRTNLGSNTTVPGLGTNAPAGALITFFVAAAPDSNTKASLDFLGPSGTVIRSFSSKEKPGDPNRLTIKAGTNRFTWDLRIGSPTKVPGLMLAEGGANAGFRIPPGTYQVRLTIGAQQQTKPLEVLPDPRTKPAAEDQKAASEILTKVTARVNEIHGRANALRAVREQVKALGERLTGRPERDSIVAAGKRLTAAIDSVEPVIINPKSKTFQDVINFKNGLNDQYLNLGAAVDGTDLPVTEGMRARLVDLEQAWQAIEPRIAAILGPELERFNALVKASGVPAVSPPG
jgi:photosystem II stability/assembly factor-like uncharacterized protein